MVRSMSLQDSTAQAALSGSHDPRAFGLVKAAYTVNDTLDLLSIGRTSLYALVKDGQLPAVKFGKRTLFYAADIAALMTRLKQGRQP
jgi:excisionase family DNA binding protein